jgi:DNA-binding NtrC family response regulator
MSVKPSVLIVQSETGARAGIEKSLGPEFDVTFVDGAERALEVARTLSFEVVCADSKVAGMPGLELLNRIHDLDPRTERILLTGPTSLFAKRGAADASDVCYVFKPFKPDDLREIVRRLAKVAGAKPGR